MNIKSFSKLTENWSTGHKMPVMFVGHGNPMNAMLENDITRGWREMSKDVSPKAILCISAHWETKGTFVTTTPKPQTIHDFGGFPPDLYQIQYPAPGIPELAKEVIRDIKKTSVQEDHDWGLDHGAWTVLIKMFPDANVPVFQMSLDYRQSPQFHYELGRELSILRDKGVLIIGSGNIIHNLSTARWNSNEPYEWVTAFDNKTKELIAEGDHQALINYHNLGTEAKLSIPSNEHYLPMLYTLGLQEKGDKLAFFNESIDLASVSMRSFVISHI